MAGGGAPKVRAGPRLSLCSVPAAYSRRRGRGWGRWGPLRLCVVGAACSLVITAGCISGGCGAWWLAAALLMTARSAPSVRPFRAGRPPAAVAAADGPAGVLAPSLRGCVLLARPAACGVTAAPRAVGCVTRTLAECSATSSSQGGVRGGWERRRPRHRLLGDLNPLTFRPSKKMDLIQTQPTPKTSGASLRYIPGYVPTPFTSREVHSVV